MNDARLDKLEKDLHTLRIESLAVRVALVGLVKHNPSNLEALQRILAAAELHAPFQQMPDQDIAAFLAELRNLVASQ
jgi:hypothetical protein